MHTKHTGTHKCYYRYTHMHTHAHTHSHAHSLTVRPDFREMTVLGAAIAAGTAVRMWEDTSLLPTPATKQFQPAITSDGEDTAAV